MKSITMIMSNNILSRVTYLAPPQWYEKEIEKKKETVK